MLGILANSWFSWHCSTHAIGAKNEGVVLNLFAKLSYTLGILANSWFSWHCSTHAIGAKNEGVVLNLFAKLSYTRSKKSILDR
jgi:hypothetical protein